MRWGFMIFRRHYLPVFVAVPRCSWQFLLPSITHFLAKNTANSIKSIILGILQDGLSTRATRGAIKRMTSNKPPRGYYKKSLFIGSFLLRDNMDKPCFAVCSLL